MRDLVERLAHLFSNFKLLDCNSVTAAFSRVCFWSIRISMSGIFIYLFAAIRGYLPGTGGAAATHT